MAGRWARNTVNIQKTVPGIPESWLRGLGVGVGGKALSLGKIRKLRTNQEPRLTIPDIDTIEKYNGQR